MQQRRFIDGNLTTAYIDEEFPGWFRGRHANQAQAQLLADVALELSGDVDDVAIIGGERAARSDATIAIQTRGALVTGTVNGEPFAIKCERATGGYRLRYQGIDSIVRVMRPRVAELYALMPEKLPPDTSKLLLCPMPGQVVDIMVSEGDAVEAGPSACHRRSDEDGERSARRAPAKVSSIPVAKVTRWRSMRRSWSLSRCLSLILGRFS